MCRRTTCRRAPAAGRWSKSPVGGVEAGLRSVRDVGKEGDADELFEVGDGHHFRAGDLDALHAVGVGADESGALQFAGRAVLDGLVAIARFGPEEDVIEHGRHGYVVAPAEADG